MCCHDDIWLHLNLTFLKPRANRCVFLKHCLEMFVLSYVNELSIYPRFDYSCLQVGLPKTQNKLDKPVCSTHTFCS